MRDERIRDFWAECISLWAKRMLMKKIVLAAAAALIVSCGLEEIGGKPVSGDDDIWVRPGANTDSVSKSDAVLYVTAVEYPDRYDWRNDSGKEEVKCSLVVYADGAPLMKIPVGEKYGVSPDPDSHRMVNGHLYTDYSYENETVIKKDGREIIRFAGREMICSLVESGDDVYTLGHDRDGGGFAYRRNGNVLLERDRGSSFEKLHRVNDNLCFAFREPIASEKETFERYYHVENGKVSQVAVREDIKKVWDIVPYKGDICCLASVVGVPSPVLIISGDMQALSLSRACNMLTCRIMHEDDVLYVEGVIERRGMEVTSGIWCSDGRVRIFTEGLTVSSMCLDGDGACCVMNPAPPHMEGMIYKCGELYPMPEGYSSIGSHTSSVINGILHAGLSSMDGGRPVVWKDGRTDTLRINGFISSISTNGN